jgi:hypothetical protein
MNIAVEAVRARGARALYAELIPTPKNAVIKDLFSGLGFARINGPAPEGTTRWAVDVLEYDARPTFIKRTPA